MKSLRKSLNHNKDSIRHHISTPLPAVSKPPSSVLPPQKVIRALAAYRPQAPQELSFQKGDFFYVLRDIDEQGAWYEAHNPVTGARGLVPRSMFEEFGRNLNSIRFSQNIGKPMIPIKSSAIDPTAPKTPKAPVFYAVVLHDFVAERADELDAKRGDPISVVAQSNREWFVAKPIGRLGRPGLIPVTFVEVRDPTTNEPISDIEALMDRGELPNVEDWKRAMLNYKQNSISLGVLEDTPQTGVPNSPYQTYNPPSAPSNMEQYSQQAAAQPDRPLSSEGLPEGILISANVVSFHYEMDDFWFRVDAVFQPFPPLGSNILPPARQLILFRVYNDFYDFQVSMLNTFPREAGRIPPNPRVLPYMPGPTDSVDREVTSTRRIELDDYLHKLCDLNESGAKYILEHEVVRSFLSLKPGDVENVVEPRLQEMEILYGAIYNESSDTYDDPTVQYGNVNVQDALGQMKLSEEDQARQSQVSGYDEDLYAPSSQWHYGGSHPYNPQPSQPNPTLRQQAITQNHQRTGSRLSNNERQASNSNSDSPMAGSSSLAQRSYSPTSNGSRSDYHRRPDDEVLSTPPLSSTSSNRSRSHSVSNLINPPISSTNPQTAFIKIKIFDRLADDLIAIRVHPRVKHADLMAKVQSRLGDEVSQLRYRDSMHKAFVEIQGDDDLRAWLEGTDKYVLYAD